MPTARPYSDTALIENTWARGIVRDTVSIPAGGVYDAVDFLVEQQGRFYKRGGWELHSASMGGSYAQWVGTIHIPTRVVAIDSAHELWDVTSENAPQADNIGACGFAPKENSPQYVDKLVLCDRDANVSPKVVYYDPGPDSLVLRDLGGSPPAACYSTVYGGRIVLGRGNRDALPSLINRIWFSPLPDVEADWLWDLSNPSSPSYSFIDTTYEVTGLTAVGGVMLIFSPVHVERILGAIPPGETGEDMKLQPFLGVGCLDARSIVPYDEEVVFAGEEGVWITNGSGLDSLTDKPDGTGIQSYWRSLFPRHHEAGEHNYRQIVCGMINRDFLVTCLLDETVNTQVTLMCHMPSRAWTKVSNFHALSMAQGRTEQETLELYFASPDLPKVYRCSSMLFPTSQNVTDGNLISPSPSLTTRSIGDDPVLKAYGFGWLTYNLQMQGFDAWAGTTAYATGEVIEASGKLFYASSGGTSGSSLPAGFSTSAYGDSVADGSVTWQDVGPQLSVSRTAGVGRDAQEDLAVLDTRSEDGYAPRGRFAIFNDFQAVDFTIAQQGLSVETNVYFLEIEARPYPTEADFDP